MQPLFFLTQNLRCHASWLAAILLLLSGGQVQCQWAIPLPDVAKGAYAITDTVYMSPTGLDSGTGSIDKPVKTFQKALQLLPFGTPGINGGHAYGLIRLLPGVYSAPEGLQQGESQWKKGNTFKNVSLEGLGNVTIVGNPLATGVIHGVRLMGDHFFVRNITINQYTGIGLFIHRPTITPEEAGPSHVRISQVTVDSTGSHGLLVFNSDIVHISQSKVLRGSRLLFDTQPQGSCTAWPSGLKLHFSKRIMVEECEVAFTRGEGLNFHNCEYAVARHNRLHDNLTNLYNDNSARLVIAANYIYNIPGAHPYAYPCPQLLSQKRLSGTGILMGNEGSCADAAHSPSFQNCQAVQCGALLVPAYRFPTIDSVFVYNNILHKCGEGIDFWQGNTDIIGPNCISNVFVFHNSFFEVQGDKEAAGAQVKFFFPVYNFLLNSYGRMKNVVFHGNLFSYQSPDHPLVIPIRQSFHPQVSQDLAFEYNVWSENSDKKGNTDTVVPDIAITTGIDALDMLDACNTSSLERDVPVPYAWFDTDYFGRPRRNGTTQAGAIERSCVQHTGDNIHRAGFTLYPNPGNGSQVTIHCTKASTLTWFTADGKAAMTWPAEAGIQTVNTGALAAGLYFVSDGTEVVKWVLIR